MATYAQFKHVELYKIGHGKNRVPNAPKSSIAEIFNADATDNGRVSNGVSRPRPVRDTPTRPRDTHSRLFGQVNNAPVQPMVTDTIRSHIQFGEVNNSCTSSPSKFNGSTCSSRGEMENAEQSSCQQPKRNPVTGDGMPYVPPRRRHPAASLREGNPITGDYKSLNGQINTVTTVSGHTCVRIPPGGYSNALW